MKKLQNLGKVLSTQEQKKIVGGYGDGSGPQVIRGRCIGSVGEWTYIQPVYYITCWNDIATYCRSGNGECLTN